MNLRAAAPVPIDRRSGDNVGLLARLAFRIDRVAPPLFPWTPFHGILAPAPAP